MIVLCIVLGLLAGCSDTTVTTVTHPIVGDGQQRFADTYGQPNPSSEQDGVGVQYSDNLGTDIRKLVVTYLNDQHHAIKIDLYAPEHHGWNLEKAKKVCTQFNPSDAKQRETFTDIDRIQNLPDGLDVVYTSSSLAKTVPTADFLHDPPGQFTVAYLWTVDSKPAETESCFVALGRWVPMT